MQKPSAGGVQSSFKPTYVSPGVDQVQRAYRQRNSQSAAASESSAAKPSGFGRYDAPGLGSGESSGNPGGGDKTNKVA